MPAGFSLKEFKAACPVTGLVMLKACSRASSRNAAGFLKYLIAQLPFTLKSIQVDGGSEFRDEFEQTCKDLDIKLYVLPPRKPKWNGCVERANGAGRYELYPYLPRPPDAGGGEAGIIRLSVDLQSLSTP